MHRFFTWLTVLAAVLFAAPAVSALEVEPTKGVVRVKLQAEVAGQVGHAPRKAAAGRLATGTARLDAASAQIKATQIRPMLPYNARFAEARARYGLDRWYVVNFDESVPVEQARKILANTPGVELSEAIIPAELKDGTGKYVTTTRPPLKASAADMMFNDPRLRDQWHYNNTAQIPNAVAGADINLFEAWKTATGSSNVVVAIIDGGIDWQHEDLAANMYVNEAELNGREGVDDDGNGYVDDIYGYNFCTNSGEIYPHQHGTHVAGTVGAVNNNGIGVAGVAGGDGTPGSGVRLLSCQVFDSRQGAPEGDFAAAIVYACEKGATIAQCSWGWGEPEYFDPAVKDAIDYFTDTARSDNMRGGLCIFAAGNNGSTGNYYPGAYERVLAVTSMTSELQPASYSNYGEWADIIAPGGLLDYGEAAGVLSTLPNNEYGYNEGTSMACPHVSGVAALILAKYGSPTFVNTMLRTQLETSVNDFYGFGDNERYRGLYGVGFLDAAKALAMGDGTAPEPVTEYTADAAQDYISLSWTIPASADNNVHHHIVYYSTEAFTAATDLSTLRSSVADTKFLTSGQTATHEIGGLEPLTTYYVALSAVNRWGNASALSPVKAVTTNAGPKMTIDASSLSLASTADTPVAKANFNIGNDAEGILKWKSLKRTSSIQPMSVARPAIGRVKAYSGLLAGQLIRPFAGVVPEYEAADFPIDLAYFNDIYAYIGDSDRSLPNSMAQWFRVDPQQYPDGFNLTEILIQGANGTNPVIQIYKGDLAISSASLLQTVNYDNFAYGYPVALNEQLYFAPGESFWIAVHFEGGQEGYPLGMASASTEGLAAYSYMSNDMGQSWTQLSVALRGSAYESVADNMTWAITARSSNPDWSDMLVLNPASGTVRYGETQPVELSVDGTRLVNGTYCFNLHLTANQTENKEITVPVSYTVNCNKADMVMPKIVDFGSLLVGESKTLEVEVYNRGYGSFRGSQSGSGLYDNNISCSSADFAGPDYVQTGFPARTRIRIPVTYKPTSAGSHTGTITFTDAEGNTARLIVHGVATEPAKLALEPAVVDAGTLTVGDAPVQVSFKLSNTGKYPLEYVFPRFSDETIEGQTKAFHKFGYTVSSTLAGFTPFAYDGNPELIGGTDVSSQFDDINVLSNAVNIGFAFPYYGKSYEKVYITSFGGLMFAPNEITMRPPLTATDSSIAGTGMISAYGQQLQMGPQSKVEYAKADGKFVVKFTDVLAVVYDQDYTPISFHMALSANGNIEIYYDNYDPAMVFQQGYGLFCGINDPALADCVTITSADMADIWSDNLTEENQRFRSFGSGTAVCFSAPKPMFIKGLNVPYGIVSPGESIDITATLQADATMNAGATFNHLALATNDPAPDYGYVRFEANIDGDVLKAAATLESDLFELGDVFRTSVQKVPVTVKNTGRRELTISSASFADGLCTTDATFPFTLEPDMAKDVIVTVPTATEGAVADVITIVTSEGELTASISANVIGCPAIELSFDAVTETVESGTPLHKDLVITNNGNETLEYALTPDPLVRYTIPELENASTSYIYSFSGDDSSVEYNWIDVETTGLGEQNDVNYYLMHDYVTVDLPFEFPFYGRKYTRMYVYNSGFISFTERRDDKIWPQPPAEFPEGSVFTNIIAPYWGMHSMDQTKTAGTFHYETEDRAVVSFIEYGNSMNVGVDFQVILEKDGSFKFQYKGAFTDAIIYNIFGLAGICNADGSSSIRLPERMVAFDKAVAFSPVQLSPVAPGESHSIGMDFDTKRMAGTYETALKLASNVPGSESLTIPVSLGITGTSAPVWPADVTSENVLGYQSADYNNPLVQMGAMYDVKFKVANEGTAPFTITNIAVGGPTIFDDWLGVEVPVFMLFANQPEIDWITGLPTGRKMWGQYEPGFTVLTVGEEAAEFSLPMLPNDLAYTPGTYTVPMTFTIETERGTEEHTMTVTFVVTPAPAMTLDAEEIRVKAVADTDSFTEALTIGNVGEYKLGYTVTLDPTGIGEEEPDLGGGIAPSAAVASLPESLRAAVRAKAPARAGEKPGLLDAPSDFEYRNALFHTSLTGNNYNYGANTLYDVFKAATVFTAPESGFNISYIYLPVDIRTATDYTVRFEIVSGDTPGEGDVLGRGSLYIASQDAPKFYIVPLDKSVFLNPGEKFHVMATYPAGVSVPAYLVPKQDAVVPGRYMGWVESYGWYDVAQLFQDNYGTLGYPMSCLETVEGKPWITLLTAGEGSVEVGATEQIKVEINAAAARMEKNNKAVLIIKSNDPAMPTVNFPVYLDKNGAPVIDAPEGVVYAKEGVVTEVSITVTEPDADNFSVTFADPSGIASVKEVTGGTVIDNGDGSYSIAGAPAATMVVAIAPDFGDAVAGNAFTVTASDVHGLEVEASVRYDIEHVNRAPVAGADAAVELAEGSTSAVVVFADLFTDPDGDELTFTFEMPENAFAEAYPNASGVIFFGKKVGVAQATVTATDPSGASTSLVLPVEVKDLSGIDSVDAATGKLTVTPNPVDGDIYAYCGFDASDAVFTLFDAAGRMVAAHTADVTAGTATVLPAAGMPQGVYILVVTTDTTTATARIIKR